MEQLPEDVLFTMIQDLSLSEIKSMCASSQKFQQMCQKERFVDLISQKKSLTYFNGIPQPITSVKIVRAMIEKIIGPTFTYKHKPKTIHQVSRMGHEEQPFCNVTIQTVLVDKLGRTITVGSKFTDFSWEWMLEDGELLVYCENDEKDHTVIINGTDCSFKTFKLNSIHVPELNCNSIISELFTVVPPDAVSTKEKYVHSRTSECQSARYKGLSLLDLKIDISKVVSIDKLRAVVIQIYPQYVNIIFEQGNAEHDCLHLKFNIDRKENLIFLSLQNYEF